MKHTKTKTHNKRFFKTADKKNTNDETTKTSYKNKLYRNAIANGCINSI